MKSTTLEQDRFRPWQPAEREWNRAAAQHLFRRAGFGAGPARIRRALEDGFAATLEELLARDSHEERLQRGIHALLPAQDSAALASWWMSLILGNGAPLRERMVLLWHDHFATSDAKVDDARMMFAQNDLFRRVGLGDFRELLRGVAKDPAMLVWLDGDQNRAGQPNENFARELLELFGLGLGNYTERDIQEAARAFTGWGTQGRSFVFRPVHHDGGTKEIFGTRGELSGDDAIDLVLSHPACARHIARRLLAEFVHPDPERIWVDELARRLVQADWNLRATVELVLRSELFFSEPARRSRIAGPVELCAATVLTLGGAGREIAPRALVEACASMGQALLRPPSVKGWDGMRNWIDAGTWVARHNLFRSLTENADLQAAFGSPGRREDVPRAVLECLLPEQTGGALAALLQSASHETENVDEALRLVTALVLTSPEYQLY